jgi:hypothetical protein
MGTGALREAIHRACRRLPYDGRSRDSERSVAVQPAELCRYFSGGATYHRILQAALAIGLSCALFCSAPPFR